MSWLSNLFGLNDPSKKAMPYMEQAKGQLEQVPDIYKQYFNPYVQQGQSAYNTLNPITSQMATDPAAYLESLMKGYTPSRGYQLQKDEALKAAGATAAAGGRRGTTDDLMNEARIADMLQGQDMQQWLQNAMGIQGQGMAGQQHFYDTGYGASQNLAGGLAGNLGDLANLLQSQGGLAFQGQNQKNANIQNLWSNAMKAAGAIGGAAMGNPMALTGLFGLGGGGSGNSGYQPFSASSPFGQRGWLQ